VVASTSLSALVTRRVASPFSGRRCWSPSPFFFTDPAPPRAQQQHQGGQGQCRRGDKK
jgi:hypothetical protein